MIRERVRDLRTNATFAERALWRHLKAKQVHDLRFRRQFPIGPYIVDFVCLRAKLTVEVDGGQHAIDIAYDDERTKWLESQGFKVIRYWNNDVRQSTEGVVGDIEARLRAIDAGGTTPSPSPSRVGEGDNARRSKEDEG